MTVQVLWRGMTAVAFLLVAIAATAAAEEDKTTTVKADKLELKVPGSWKQEKPSSNLRLTQFRIPAAEGDKEDGELAVFNFGASDPQANVRRWIGQFKSEGREVKIFSGESGQGRYVFVDLAGTYNKPVGPPIQGKTEPVPNSRVLAVILASKDKGVYYLKMVGPDKTIAGQATALRNAFGADAEKEKELEFEQ